MNRIFLITFILILTSCTASHKLATVHIIDTNGFSQTISTPVRLQQFERTDFLSQQPYKKVFRTWKEKPPESNKSILTSYHPSGQIMQYLEGKGSKAWGSYKEWYENGHLKVQVQVVGGRMDFGEVAENSWIFDGLSEAYDENGVLQAQIPYCKGSKEGLAKLFHVSGKLWQQMSYHHDQLQGPYLCWYEEGHILFKQNYHEGLLEGRAERYWPNHSLAADELYKKGFLQEALYFDPKQNELAHVKAGSGKRVVFGKNGIAEIQTIQKGVIEGKVSFYDHEGFLEHEVHISNGLKNGQEIFYYPPSSQAKSQDESLSGGDEQSLTSGPSEDFFAGDPSLARLSLQWRDGFLQGTVRSWFKNGQIESEKLMLNEKLHGHCAAYYPQGEARLIEQYEHGKLVNGDYFSPGSIDPVCCVKEGNGHAIIYNIYGEVQREIIYRDGLPVPSEGIKLE
jgi:antitoxin component YwqK of YwqJK toxin-antitoxin module